MTIHKSIPFLQRIDWFSAFTALVVLLPLPFGSNRPWASDLFSVLSALFLLGMAFDIYRSPSLWPRGAPVKRLVISAALMTLTGLWAFLQTQSWMPASWFHPLWQNVQNLPGASSGSISIEPDQFSESIARLTGYTCCFLIAFVYCRNREKAQNMLQALAIAAAIYALYGLLVQSAGLQMILWYKKWAYENSLTSTFVNKNSYATYAGLGLQVCLALLWQRLKRRPELNAKSDPKAKAAWLEMLSGSNSYYFIMSFAVLGALLLTGSRAGIVSSLAGCVIFLAALAINRRWRWTKWLPPLVIGFAIIIGYSLVNNQLLFDLLDNEKIRADAPLRLKAYAIELSAISSNPWLGFGLGSFESVFRLYRDPSFDLWFQHAHNDYLELAIELGVPGALMLLTAILLLVSCCIEGIWRRHRGEVFPALGLSASVTVGLHSLADFSMQIPAVAATYAVLLGMGVAQSWSSRNQKSEIRNQKSENF